MDRWIARKDRRGSSVSKAKRRNEVNVMEPTYCKIDSELLKKFLFHVLRSDKRVKEISGEVQLLCWFLIQY